MHPLAVPLAAQTPEAVEPAEVQLFDRIVAVVDQDPIFQGEIERIIELGLTEPREGEGPEAFRRRVLEELIERRLRYQKVGLFGTRTVSVEEIEAAVEELRSRISDQGRDFDQALAAADMTIEELRQIVARQLAVVDYVDRQLGTRVFISLEDIQSYYDEELVPRLRSQNAEIPPLDEVRETIRHVLQEQRLNEEIEKWTEDLRRKADVRILIDDYPDELPPLRRRIGSPQDATPPARSPPP